MKQKDKKNYNLTIYDLLFTIEISLHSVTSIVNSKSSNSKSPNLLIVP